MEILAQFIDIILHLDKHLALLVESYGVWVYAILFAIVFMETGFVVTPFLPGDSLLFVAGAVAAAGGMDVQLVAATLLSAALCGDNVNYWIGRFVGPKVFKHEGGRWLKRENLERTHAFMEKHGPKAIIIARFVPIVRTFLPFVAGGADMPYRTFAFYNITGAIAWVGICVGAGYLFGNIPVVKENFELVVLGIVGVSVLPIVFEFVKMRRARA